jgi:D-hexose-6-phosphate mutarotase
MNLNTLNEQFGLKPGLVFKVGPGELMSAEITNKLATANIALHGGHVLSFQPHGQQPVLWASRYSHYTAGKAIRGGIPICWPWFAAHPTDAGKPAHGFARISLWTVLGSETTAEGATRLRLGLADTEATRALWPYPFQLELTITVGANLSVELLIRNPGPAPFTCTGALHSYFSVSDIAHVTIQGLEGCAYLDKVAGNQRREQTGPVTISGETDRIYLDTTADCFIVDPGWQRQVRVAKQGSRTTVVWNPWVDRAGQLADFGDEEYRQMVCVEAVNTANDIITLSPGSRHLLQTTLSSEAG